MDADDVCINFKKNNNCTPWCAKFHKYDFCRDYANNYKCEKFEKCIYMHLSYVEQQLNQRGNREIMKIVVAEASRTYQLGGVCRTFRATRQCSKENCAQKHFSPKVKNQAQPICRICNSCIASENACVLSCGHLICGSCHIHILEASGDSEDMNRPFKCPMCRKISRPTYI